MQTGSRGFRKKTEEQGFERGGKRKKKASRNERTMGTKEKGRGGGKKAHCFPADRFCCEKGPVSVKLAFLRRFTPTLKRDHAVSTPFVSSFLPNDRHAFETIHATLHVQRRVNRKKSIGRCRIQSRFDGKSRQREYRTNGRRILLRRILFAQVRE